MKIEGVLIQDTYAEAWDLEVVRLTITAISTEVAWGAAHQFAGAAGSSEIGSRMNAGIERAALPQETPDGRPGVIVACTMPPQKRQQLVDEIVLRVALATLVPTCALFDAMVSDVADPVTIDLYGPTASRWQGYDTEVLVGDRRVCAVPTTTGEFRYEKTLRLSTSGTDGHLVCYADSPASAVMAVQSAKDALVGIDGVAPMGFGLEQVFRELDYVPALRHLVEHSRVPEGVGSILNLLMFGCTGPRMRQGMAAAIRAAARVPGIQEIGAWNFGGQFGRHRYFLHEILSDS